MFARVKKAGKYEYLQIVESRREGKKIKQRVIATLGRLDALTEAGTVDSLMKSLGRFSEKARIWEQFTRGELEGGQFTHIGPDLVFSRLWGELGIGEVLKQIAAQGRHQFDLERAAYLSVVHRLMESGSDRQADRWRRDYSLPGTEDVEYHHMLRAMRWLGAEKNKIEESLFMRDRDLFSGLTMSFFDTTSIYFEGRGGESLGQWGHSKDHRPDLKQVVLGALLSDEGRPISTEIWPGNTADSTVLLPVVERMRERFGITDACIVADRGMISRDTVEALEEKNIGYILGARMRNDTVVKNDILRRGGRFSKVAHNLEVKEVRLPGGKRYIVCFNPEQAQKDRADREAIIGVLQEKLSKGQSRFIGNKGYRKYLKVGKGAMSIDHKKAERESRYDGKFVLRTNTLLTAGEAAVQYKRLLEVESFFRSVKSLVDTRPVYHKWDATITGHIFVSFLALTIRYELMKRIEKSGVTLEWNDIRRDIDALGAMNVNSGPETWQLRTPAQGVCDKVFKAAGVAFPPSVIQL